MASQDIGKLGPKDSSPVLFHWRWYYHVPTLPLWALILLLLVVPRANRQRQAWLILVPLALILIAWRMPAMLVGMPDSAAESLGTCAVSYAMGWSAVWLLGDWIGTRYRSVTFVLILGVLLAVGLLSYCCRFPDADDLIRTAIAYGLFVSCPVLAMLLTSRSCGRTCTLRRFLVWLMVWSGAAALGMMLCDLALIAVIAQMELSDLVGIALFAVPMTLILGGILYLLNLPFVILAFKSRFYGKRLQRLFGTGPEGARVGHRAFLGNEMP